MTPREGVWALLAEARDGLQLDADERKQQLASLSVARPGMFDALVYNDAEIKRNRALVARIDEALAHPAATAREEALAKCVAALTDARVYVDDMATWTDDSDTSHYAADPTSRAYAKAVLDRLDAALALARKCDGKGE